MDRVVLNMNVNIFCKNIHLFLSTILCLQCGGIVCVLYRQSAGGSILRLQLQQSKIKAVDTSLGFYALLQFVDLTSNQMISLPDSVFNQKKKLEQLPLNNNIIFKLSNPTLEGLRTHIILTLRKNFRVEVSFNILSSLK